MTDAPRLTDSHCHLDFPDFGGDTAGLVARANAAGVHRMVTICTRLRNEPAVRAIATRNIESVAERASLTAFLPRGEP